MATILLCVIFLMFVGLGLPDSLFGVAWPVIYKEFGVGISYANIVTMTITCGTIVSSFVSETFIHRFGTRWVTAASTLLTAVALFGFSISNHIVWLCVFAIPLGLGAGAIDTGLNNYVAIHYKATHMNFLHCFYGVGVSLSPYIMSMAIGDGVWQRGYRIVAMLQLGIAAAAFATVPVWNKAFPEVPRSNKEQVVVKSKKELLRNPLVILQCVSLLAACAVELTCGMWSSSYFVHSRGIDPALAARFVLCFYVGMALGRFLSGVFANILKSWQLITIGETIALIALIVLILPVANEIAVAALFMIGFGMGPVFPNYMHLTPIHFGERDSVAVTGIEMSFAYVGILVTPALFGLLAEWIGTDCFGIFVGIFAVVMFITSILLKRAFQSRKTLL